MTVRAWRIVKAKHLATAFDGEGARRFGGRWNSPGRRMVYTAESVALALLEMTVHADQGLLRSYQLLAVEFDEAQVTRVEVGDLPSDWRAFPAPHVLQTIGDAWLDAGESLVLSVPSAIVPMERNFLLNPEHPEMASVTIGEPQPFELDVRLG